MLTVTYNAQFCPKRHKAARAAHVAAFDTLAALAPEVIGVCEAGGYRRELANVTGYRAIQPKGSAGRCALLIRDDLTVHDSGASRLHGRRFVGRDVPGARVTGWTKPRDILWAIVSDDHDGLRRVVASWHPVPGQSHSARARKLLAEEAQKAAEWVKAQKYPVDLMGDTNGDPGLLLFKPLRGVASPAFAVSRGKDRIDGHWIAGGTGQARALDGYPSDHKPVAAVITWADQLTPVPPPEAPVKFKAPAPTYLGPAAHTSKGNNKPIKRIVMHSTVSACKAGGAQAIARYFRSEAAGGSAHYVVDPAGAVQVVYDGVIAWHAPPNANSLGVEMCDMPGADSGHKASVKRWNDKNHSAMLDHAAELVAGLCLAYDVPIRKIGPGQLKAGKHGICGHVDVSEAWHQSTHWDPGNFPWPRFIALVQAKADAMQGKDDPTPKPDPKPAPTPPVPTPAAPAPVDRPYHERQAINEARTVARNAKKAGHKHRASMWRSILDTMLGRKK